MYVVVLIAVLMYFPILNYIFTKNFHFLLSSMISLSASHNVAVVLDGKRSGERVGLN